MRAGAKNIGQHAEHAPVEMPIRLTKARISTGCWRSSVSVVITSAEWWTLWNSHRLEAVEQVMAEPIGQLIGEQFEQRRHVITVQAGQAVG